MKIHEICLVKNEADVLQECLVSALHWCDYIYVFGNGSDDGSWEMVNELATKHPQIVPYKQENTTYNNGLRGRDFQYTGVMLVREIGGAGSTPMSSISMIRESSLPRYLINTELSGRPVLHITGQTEM